MYNAERTIERTLTSVQTQTLTAIEIIVVDDGSTDAGPSIVERHALSDSRVQLLRKRNQGVAAARNHGARRARARLLSFIDADDLWAPEALARQYDIFVEEGGKVGLVYSWFARINDKDEIVSYESSSVEEGDVLSAICLRNFIGNGSSSMIRRDLFEEVGGFDASLRDHDAEGCEDYDLFGRLAGRCEFRLVRAFDVGYRQANDNMSGNLARMARSRSICASRLLRRHPDHAKLIRHGRRRFLRWSLRRALRLRRWDYGLSIMALMLKHEPVANLVDLPGLLLRGREIRLLADRMENSGVAGEVFRIGALAGQSEPMLRMEEEA
jgi:glycosyltransferase involved in cell wall biosynthesis